MVADSPGALRRRRVLAALGSAAVVGAAGCTGDGNGDGETPSATSDGSVDPTTTTGASGRLPAPSMSSGDPDVTVAVYKDFACPHCATYAAEVEPQVVGEYVDTGEVSLAHHDFPIPVDDPESWRAANAARAVQADAGDTAFFAYADRLFENQSSLGLDTYADLAEEVPGETVRSAASDRSYDDTVESDRSTGIDRGVQGTPTVFVDGEALDGWGWETVEAAVEDARSE
jgi:protein-disulfide isomerase